MKIPTLVIAVLVFAGGFSVAAASDERTNYSPETALATLEVMEQRTSEAVDEGMYSYYQDGDDLVLRKRPGRAKYGDITLKRGARCGQNDCDDGDTNPRPETRMNKAELVEAIASKSGLSKADSKKALEGFADSEVKAIKKGEEVKLVGVGSFYQEYCPKTQGAKEKAKKTACRSSLPDYLDSDSDGDGIGTLVLETNEDNNLEIRSARKGSNPQTGKEIQIAAKNVRGSGATGEITTGEEVSINLPNGRRIIREVGAKK